MHYIRTVRNQPGSYMFRRVRIVENHWLPRLLGAGGVTLSAGTIRLARPVAAALKRNPLLLSHEVIHTWQAYDMGWRYLPVYLWRWALAGFRYHRHPMERAAWAREAVVEAGQDTISWVWV